MKQLDKYYTKKNIASKCYEELELFVNKYIIPIEKRIFYVEPCMGNGDMFDLLPKYKTGFDIDSKRKNCIRKNFLTDSIIIKDFIDDIKPLEWYVVSFTNPPYGKKYKLAIDFFNKMASFSNVIAVIMPITFINYNQQKRLDKNWVLYSNTELPQNSFYTENNRHFGIKTVFQIWYKKDNFPHIKKNIRIETKPKDKHPDFDIFISNCTKNTEKYFNQKEYKWDLALHRQGYYFYNRIYYNNKDMKLNRSYLFFKIKNNNQKQKIINIFKSLDWSKISRMYSIQQGLNRQTVIKYYVKAKK